jgi:hypothetical protein
VARPISAAKIERRSVEFKFMNEAEKNKAGNETRALSSSFPPEPMIGVTPSCHERGRQPVNL